LKSLSSLSSNVESVPRRIELTFGPRLASFALICVIYFASCQKALGLEPIVGAVGLGLEGLAALVTFIVVSGAVLYFIRRRVSVPPRIPGRKVEFLVDSSSLDAEEVAWRYLRKQNLDGGG